MLLNPTKAHRDSRSSVWNADTRHGAHSIAHNCGTRSTNIPACQDNLDGIWLLRGVITFSRKVSYKSSSEEAVHSRLITLVDFP